MRAAGSARSRLSGSARLRTPASAAFCWASASISSVMSSPYALPVGPTRFADRITSPAAAGRGRALRPLERTTLRGGGGAALEFSRATRFAAWTLPCHGRGPRERRARPRGAGIVGRQTPSALAQVSPNPVPALESLRFRQPAFEPVRLYQPANEKRIRRDSTTRPLLAFGVEDDQAAATVFEGATEVAVKVKRVPVFDVFGDRRTDTLRVVLHEIDVREPRAHAAFSPFFAILVVEAVFCPELPVSAAARSR